MSNAIASLIFRHRETGEQQVYPMQNDASTIVGRDPGCTIHLESPDVSGKHCTLRIADKQVFINDWYSEHGTIINGQPITNETELKRDDQLQIGSFDVQVVYNQNINEAVHAQPQYEIPVSETPAPSTAEPAVETDQQTIPDSHDELIASLQTSMSPSDPMLQEKLDRLTAENRELRSELESILAESAPQTNSNSSASHGFEQDEIESLRREVTALQSELAARDQEIADLCDGEFASAKPEEDQLCDTPQLVERLESLLDELQSTDHRIQSMEELLRVADEAQLAEVEERRQIEDWVTEIETRVRRREEEWQSQNEQLNNQIAELKEQREQAHEQLGQALDSNGDEVAKQTQQQLEQTQAQNNKLAELAMELKRENEALKEKMSEFQSEAESGESPAVLQRKLREHELELAQERAEMSRQRAELTRMRDELDRATGEAQKDVGTSDLRVKALRDHLREIHDQEQEQRAEERGGGLASRLSRLWQRLDSR